MQKLLLILFVFLIAGCEVLEEDISGKKVRIIAPADRVSVTAGQVDFRWLAVEYAVGYEFTVVTPSFAAAERVMVDTVILSDTLGRRFGCRLLLSEGDYEWSVRGFNSGYTTRSEVRRLTVVPVVEPENSENSDPAEPLEP